MMTSSTGRHLAAMLVLLHLLRCVVPARAQEGASPSIPFGPMVIIALILSLMAAALIVVAFVTCHFNWVVKNRVRRRGVPMMAARLPVKPAEPFHVPSTVPKQQTAQVSKPRWTEPQLLQQQQLQRLPEQRGNANMRHTGSQFVEFLSRKWAVGQQVSQQQPKQLTTFKPAAAAAPTQKETVQLVRVADLPTQSNDFFDVCETDVGQYDNLIAGRAAPRGEAYRYEVAMELRDTRRSRASTPGVSARDVDLASGADTMKSGASVEWYEEVSAAL